MIRPFMEGLPCPGKQTESHKSCFIGVGRFRILGGGGGARFRILGGGGGGGQIPSRHMTS